MRAIQSRAGPISKRDNYKFGQKFKVQMCTACHMGMRAQFSSSSLVTPSYALLVASFRLARNSSLYTVFQVAFGLPIAFSTSSEGSAIEMKPTAPVPEDTAVSLKA